METTSQGRPAARSLRRETHLAGLVLWCLRSAAALPLTAPLTAPGIAWVLCVPPASVATVLDRLHRAGVVQRAGYGFTRQGRRARAWRAA